jgi:hypothetical protein
MRGIRWIMWVCFTVGMATVGCSSSSNGPPQILITSPQSGTVVQLMSSNTTMVNFSVSNFNLQQPGTCNGAANCGQVYADIDNGACNAGSKMYNAIAPSPSNGSTSAVTLDFSLCPASTFSGNHSVTLSLRLDNGAEVIGAGNAPAVAQISITTTGGSVTPSQVDGSTP